jgi:hypothetical protein
MKRYLKSVLTSVAVVSLMAVTLSVKGQETFDKRWNDTVNDLKKFEADIPSEKLVAKGIELLRTRIIAKEDEVGVGSVTADVPAKAKAEACVAFDKRKWNTFPVNESFGNRFEQPLQLLCQWDEGSEPHVGKRITAHRFKCLLLHAKYL